VSRRTVRRFAVAVGATLIASRLPAQVGYPPTASPYTEIDKGMWVEAYGGHVFGSGGPLLVGPRDGAIYGGRLDLRGQHALQVSFGGWYTTTVRNVVNANDSVATRVKGPVPEKMFAFQVGAQLNLAGGKAWHRLAPFVTLNLGIVHGQGPPPSDTSGYSFGTKLYFSPAAGVRLIINQRLFLAGEAQALFWKLSYPVSYSLEPAKQPGTAGHSNAVNTTGASSQYVMTPALRLGLGIAF
jgi:hypothetical protein